MRETLWKRLLACEAHFTCVEQRVQTRDIRVPMLTNLTVYTKPPVRYMQLNNGPNIEVHSMLR